MAQPNWKNSTLWTDDKTICPCAPPATRRREPGARSSLCTAACRNAQAA